MNLWSYIAKRILLMIPTLLGVVLPAWPVWVLALVGMATPSSRRRSAT